MNNLLKMNNSLENLSDLEFLTLLMGSDDAKTILNKYKEIYNLKDININCIDNLKISDNSKNNLKLFLSFSKREYIKRNVNKPKLFTSKEIYEYMKYYYSSLKQEVFYALYFNNKQELIEAKMLFKGTVNRTTIHPREIFKEAVLLSASRIVCMHNHPSGDVKPSIDDMAFSETINEAGKIIGIPVIDHIIVSDEGYYSFLDNNKYFSRF